MPFEPLDQFLQRQKKLEQIAALGSETYPHKFDQTDTPADIVARCGSRTAEELQTSSVRVRSAGRIMRYRLHGKTGFADIQGGGQRVQVYFKRDTIGDRLFELFLLLDMGDIIGVAGHLFRTRTGELTIWAEDFALLAKALLPLPEKWHGLADVELRYRQRYLDLIVNQDVRRIFERRAQIVREIRRYFDARGYLEVETPMLQPIAGGAAARPFITHHNALDMDLYLRIAPELYLKRLIVSGFDRVYEINRNFRNEGIGWRWNPEFTMLEFYQAYSDYRDLMDLSEELLTGVVETVSGSRSVRYGEHDVDFSRWQRLSMREAIAQYWPEGAGTAPTPADLARPGTPRALVERFNSWAASRSREAIAAPAKLSDGELTGLLFEFVAEENLIQPTLIYDYPADISPLSKCRPDDPTIAERFEIFAGALELGNAFSELNDPLEQERRFLRQVQEGGEEAPKEVDLDYVRALCHALPPTAGEGIGIDRLVMLLTNSHTIREVILFPLLRPESHQESRAAAQGDGGTPSAPGTQK